IDQITPLYTAHSERTRIKPERMRKILISAMKQSLKYTLPLLDPALTFAELTDKPFDGQKFIAYCETGAEESLITQYKKGSDVLILIGPEGDFSPEEVALAIRKDFIPVNLGEARLRTETAGVVACHTIHLMNHLVR
ncbi:MAG TPA: RsmE family RNA methyltransferase, partial [Bacteroidales bacterium]|nr:RsmE family RNA methyltransferase [Bacteroidales bacterium]